MALFKKKKKDDGGGGNGGNGDSAFEPQPEKARAWFEHAQTAADSSNYAYALQCYANGLKLDPGSLSSHERMWEAAIRYQGGKAAASREIKSIDDGTPVGKFAAAEFEWIKDLRNHKTAIKALESAVKAGQLEYGNWIAPRVLLLVRNQKKVTKGSLLQAMNLFREVGAWDESLAAGQLAFQLDPSDAALDAELKNLSAQRAMDQGGYSDAAGEEGGFRKFIKDADRQRELVEGETLAAGSSVEERNLARARQAYEETPTSPDVLNLYAQLIKKQGTPEAERQAQEIYEKGFEEIGEYRFRMNAGDIRIEQLEREVRTLEEKLEASPDNGAVKEEHEEARRALLDLKSSEYSERVAKYPTDRHRRFELGEVQYELGQYEDAMAQFQTAKDEPKLRVRAGHKLGRCFFAEGWYGEAISEFEEALAAIDATERQRELVVKYDLMLGLLAAAREENSIDLAQRAKTICSEIARKDIQYRDIRAKRREVDEVIRGIIGPGNRE